MVVSPNILVFYASTWKCVIPNPERRHMLDIPQFLKSLPILRNYLSCVRCENFLGKEKGEEGEDDNKDKQDKHLFSTEGCDHFLCNGCRTTKSSPVSSPSKRRSCSSCTNMDDYSSDEVLSLLISGYSRYCRVFLSTPECTDFLLNKWEETKGREGMVDVDLYKILEILREGAMLKKRSMEKEVPTPTSSPPLKKSKITGKAKAMFIKDEDEKIDIKIEPIYQSQMDEEDDEEEEMKDIADSDGNEEEEEEPDMGSPPIQISLPSPVVSPSKLSQPTIASPSSPSTSSSPRFVLTRPAVRLPAGQTIRLARLTALPDGMMVRQGHGGLKHFTLPISTAELIRNKKIIVRPALSPHTVVSVSSSGTPTDQRQRHNQFTSVAMGVVASSHSSLTSSIASSTIPTSAVLTGLSLPPNMIGKTIKVQIPTPSASIASSSSITQVAAGPSKPSPEASTSTSAPTTSTSATKPSVSKSRNGCRCGNAASQPSKLTCCGQRCVCYVDGRSCVGCKCRGCNNPYLPGGSGKKLLQGISTVVDTKSNTNTSTPVTFVSSSAVGIPSMGMGISAGSGIASSSVTTSTTHHQPQHQQHHHHHQTTFSSTSVVSTPTAVNLVPVMASGSGGHPHIMTGGPITGPIITRIHHQQGPGQSGSQAPTTFSQIIPVANFTGQFGQFTIPLPISLISPANAQQGHHHTLHQSPGDLHHHQPHTIHLQNIQPVQISMQQQNLQNPHPHLHHHHQ